MPPLAFDVIRGGQAMNAEERTKTKYPKAKIFPITISCTTTAYRVGIRRGPRAKLWISTFWATPEEAWDEAASKIKP